MHTHTLPGKCGQGSLWTDGHDSRCPGATEREGTRIKGAGNRVRLCWAAVKRRVFWCAWSQVSPDPEEETLNTMKAIRFLEESGGEAGKQDWPGCWQ